MDWMSTPIKSYLVFTVHFVFTLYFIWLGFHTNSGFLIAALAILYEMRSIYYWQRRKKFNGPKDQRGGVDLPSKNILRPKFHLSTLIICNFLLAVSLGICVWYWKKYIGPSGKALDLALVILICFGIIIFVGLYLETQPSRAEPPNRFKTSGDDAVVDSRNSVPPPSVLPPGTRKTNEE